MEEKLKLLLDVSNELNRHKWALQYKEKGRKVIGLIAHQFIPQEIIHAAGALSVRLIGSWEEGAPLAEVHRTKISCRYNTHVLENLLQNKYNYLDGILAAGYDDDVRTTWDVLDYYKMAPYRHILFVPHKAGALDLQYWLVEIENMRKQVEELTGHKVTDKKLYDSIGIYNLTRTMFQELYELQKRPDPPLLGSEVVALSIASTLMPREEFNDRLCEIMPYLKTRTSPCKAENSRILVSSDHLDDMRYLKVLEGAGCNIVIGDLDTDRRIMLGHVNEEMYNPEYSLAKFYLHSYGTCPHMCDWDKQLEEIAQWVNEYKVDGIIELPVLYSFPREFLTPYYQTEIEKKGIPFISVRREYGLANEGQLSTRVGAFAEMISN